jgi:hypothetical protein
MAELASGFCAIHNLCKRHINSYVKIEFTIIVSSTLLCQLCNQLSLLQVVRKFVYVNEPTQWFSNVMHMQPRANKEQWVCF